MANLSKEKGNAAFKLGEWVEAVGHYSAAILEDPRNPILPLNRAAAYLKLEKNVDAERDCTTALALDPKNVKALFRRAQARLALERYPDSERDLLDALRLDSANDAVKKELAVVQKRKNVAEKKAAEKRQPISIPAITPSSQSPQLPKQRVIRNVPIEIVEPESESTSTSTLAKPDLLTAIESRPIPPDYSRSGHTPSSLSSPSLSPSTSPAPAHAIGAGIYRANGKSTILRSPTQPIVQSGGGSVASASAPSDATSSSQLPPAAPPVSVSQPPPISSSSFSAVSQTANPIPPPIPAALPTISSTSTLALPQTLFAFTRAWNALSTSHERFSLLQRIPPYTLPPLVKNGLEPELLVSLVTTLRDVASSTVYPRQTLLPYLCIIPAITRFETVLKFLSPTETGLIREMWESMGDADGDDWVWVRRAWGV